MKEIQFIGKNKQRWGEFEKKLSKNAFSNLNELTQDYVLLNEDLSYAQTNYPKSDITKYLNQLVQRTHQLIHQPKGEQKNRVKTFWLEEIPKVIWTYKKYLLTSIAIFVICFCVGYYSGNEDKNFARAILGDYYVEMTLDNMESGKPTGVYAQGKRSSSFLRITFNNVRVSFMAFAFGILFILGTVIILVFNGIMVGVFQQFFIEHGHGEAFFYAVWMHGTIELWSIMIAGGAGIVLGKGLFFPGTYSRVASFKKHATDATKIIIGLVPFFIIAGFIEGYFTRIGPDNKYLSLSIIIGSILLIAFYFFYLPYKQSKKNGILQNS